MCTVSGLSWIVYSLYVCARVCWQMGCLGGATLSHCRMSTPTRCRRLWCSTSGCCWRSFPTEVTHTHTHFLPPVLSLSCCCNVLPSPTTRGSKRVVQRLMVDGTGGRFFTRLHHAVQPHACPEFISLCSASGEGTCFCFLFGGHLQKQHRLRHTSQPAQSRSGAVQEGWRSTRVFPEEVMSLGAICQPL